MEYPKNLPTWAYIVLAIIVGGGLANFLPYFQIFKEGERDQIAYLQKELSETKVELREVTKELMFIKEKLIQLTATTKDNPFPNWITNKKGALVFLSDSYENEFLTPIGMSKQDFTSVEEVFGAETARNLARFHKIVVKDGREQSFIVGIVSPITGETEKWIIQKWPWRLGNEIIGVNGIAVKIPN